MAARIIEPHPAALLAGILSASARYVNGQLPGHWTCAQIATELCQRSARMARQGDKTMRAGNDLDPCIARTVAKATELLSSHWPHVFVCTRWTDNGPVLKLDNMIAKGDSYIVGAK